MIASYWNVGAPGIQPAQIAARRQGLSPAIQGARQVTGAGTGNVATGGGSFGGGTAGLGAGSTPEQIAQLVNEINQRAQRDANTNRVPAGAQLDESVSRNILADLNFNTNQGAATPGQMNPALMGAMNDFATFNVMTGQGSGAPGGGWGLAVMREMQRRADNAQNQLAQFKASNPAAPIYDAGNQVLTAAQREQIELENRRLLEDARSNREREQIAWAEMNRRGSGGGGSSSAFRQPSATPRQFTGYDFTDLFNPPQDTRFAPSVPGMEVLWERDYDQLEADAWDDFFGNTTSQYAPYIEPWMGSAYQSNTAPIAQPDYSDYVEPWMAPDNWSSDYSDWEDAVFW